MTGFLALNSTFFCLISCLSSLLRYLSCFELGVSFCLSFSISFCWFSLLKHFLTACWLTFDAVIFFFVRWNFLMTNSALDSPLFDHLAYKKRTFSLDLTLRSRPVTFSNTAYVLAKFWLPLRRQWLRFFLFFVYCQVKSDLKFLFGFLCWTKKNHSFIY